MIRRIASALARWSARMILLRTEKQCAPRLAGLHADGQRSEHHRRWHHAIRREEGSAHARRLVHVHEVGTVRGITKTAVIRLVDVRSVALRTECNVEVAVFLRRSCSLGEIRKVRNAIRGIRICARVRHKAAREITVAAVVVARHLIGSLIGKVVCQPPCTPVAVRLPLRRINDWHRRGETVVAVLHDHGLHHITAFGFLGGLNSGLCRWITLLRFENARRS